MKKPRLAVWLTAMIMVILFTLLGACIRAERAAPSSNAHLILNYHASVVSNDYSQAPGWVEAVCDSTAEWAERLGVGKDTQILLSMWEVESGFSPSAKSPEGCRGITQLRSKDMPYFYSLLKKSVRGLPPLKEIMKYPDYQVALGVVAFKCKLHDANGRTWEAVRRYNGAGPAAEEYRTRVRKVYNRMFRHVGGTAIPRIGMKKGEGMKTFFLGLMLAATPMIYATEVPEAQEVSETVTVLRDHNFKQYPCYGCPGDPSSVAHIPAIVKAQKAAYQAARDKYKKTWKLADVEEASRLAFSSPVAAWPYYNYANHLIENEGDQEAAEKALRTAESLMKGFDGPIVDEITDLIAARRKNLSE